jgi:hypothetical protein
MRLRMSSAVVALAGAGVAAGCNFIVGVGDYAADEAGSDCTDCDDGAVFADDASDAMTADGGDATLGARADAGSDVIVGDADAGTDGPGSCSPAAVSGCAIGTVEYACTGSAKPGEDRDASPLACTPAPDGGASGATDYCCVTSTCSVTAATEDGGYGYPCDEGPSWSVYTCTGTDSPRQLASPLACEFASVCGGATSYCCGTSTCSSNTVSCGAGQAGYTCTGIDSPADINVNIACTNTTLSGNTGPSNWCCSPAPITCVLDSTVTCSSYYLSGYSCTGSDTPWNDFPQVDTCSVTGVSGTGATQYCCSPACSTNEDCQSAAYGTVCVEGACELPTGVVGDPCGSGWPACSGTNGSLPDGGAVTCSLYGIACTQACTTDQSCGVNSAYEPNGCVATGDGGDLCFPGCNSNGDCAAFNAGAFCTPETAGGITVCQASSGQIGDPCSIYSQDCTAAGSFCDSFQGFCTKGCESTSDTSCGSNSEGNQNYCAAISTSDYQTTATGYECYPGCQGSTDCTPYTSTNCGATQSSCVTTYSDSDGSFYSYCTLTP